MSELPAVPDGLTDEERVQELAQIEAHSIALLTHAKQMLVEAKTVPQLRAVQEQLKFITEAARRAALLAQGQRMASEHVEAMRNFANDSAAAHIESQIRAGELIKEMRAQGTLQTGAGRISPADREKGVQAQADLFGGNQKAAEHAIQTWERLADIPTDIHIDYVDKTKDRGGEVTTAGLLRYAATQADNGEPNQRTDVEEAYTEVVKAFTTILKYDSALLAGHASNTKQKTRFRRLLVDIEKWASTALDVYGSDNDK